MAKRKTKTPPQKWPVTTEVGGQTYTGEQWVEGGMITVEYRDGIVTTRKTTQVGGSGGGLGRLLLGELVRESNSKKAP